MAYSIYKPTIENIVKIAEDVGIYPHDDLATVIPFVKSIYPHTPMFHSDIYVQSVEGSPLAYQDNTMSYGLVGLLLDDIFTELNLKQTAKAFAEESVLLAANIGKGILGQQVFPKDFNIDMAGNLGDLYEFPDVSNRYLQSNVPLARLTGYANLEDYLGSLDKKRRYKCKESTTNYEAVFTSTLDATDVIWITSRVNENFHGTGPQNDYVSEIAMLQWLPYLYSEAFNIKLYDKATGQLAAITSFSRIAQSPNSLVYNCYAGDRKFKNAGLASLVSMIKYLFDSGLVFTGSVDNLHVGYAYDFTPVPYGTYKRHCCNMEIQSLKLLATYKEKSPYEVVYPPYYNLDTGKWIEK